MVHISNSSPQEDEAKWISDHDSLGDTLRQQQDILMGKGLVTTSDDLIWYSHSVGEENQLSQVVLWSAHVQFGTFVHMHTHTEEKEAGKMA